MHRKEYKAINDYRNKNDAIRQKVKMRNVLLDYLPYRDLNQNMVYTDNNRNIGSFD